MPPSNQPLTPLSPAPKKLLYTISALALVGFADSAYLTADHYLKLPLPCSLLHGCEKVLTSSYSMVGPIPLAAFGVVFYLMVLFFALYLVTAPAVSKLERQLLFALTVIGLACSIAFESIQAFIIGAFCEYCAISALVTLLLFLCGLALLKRPGAAPQAT